MTYTREKLIEICGKSIVPQNQWFNRDSAGAQRQVGELFVLLQAGCDFEILTDGLCATDEHTIWVEVEYKGFSYFDYGTSPSKDTFYLPTEKRLQDRVGTDWY